MTIKQAKKTARQTVSSYAERHGLEASGSQRDGLITIMDKSGHWSESWSVNCETWEEARELLSKIEEGNVCGFSRPWEIARKGYKGEMKPLAA